MRQIVYQTNNIQKNYLCAYANAWVADGKLYMINTLNNKKVIVQGDEKDLRYILTLLNEGVSDEKLIQFFSKMKQIQLYEILLRAGIIE